jgi:hypothetical protein
VEQDLRDDFGHQGLELFGDDEDVGEVLAEDEV